MEERVKKAQLKLKTQLLFAIKGSISSSFFKKMFSGEVGEVVLVFSRPQSFITSV